MARLGRQTSYLSPFLMDFVRATEELGEEGIDAVIKQGQKAFLERVENESVTCIDYELLKELVPVKLELKGNDNE